MTDTEEQDSAVKLRNLNIMLSLYVSYNNICIMYHININIKFESYIRVCIQYYSMISDMESVVAMSVLYSYLTPATSSSRGYQGEVEDRSSSHLEGGQDDHIFTEMFASRKELLGREMWEESEGSPGDEGGDFLEVHRNLQVFTSGVGCQLGKSINRTVRCWIEFNQFLNITFTLWIIIL